MAQVVFKDADIYSRIINGEPVEWTQDKAISNAIIAWFTSKAGEYIYQPNLGGILDRSLFKLQDPKSIAALKTFFQEQLDANFGGIISVTALKVEPDKNLRLLTITIQYTSLLTNNLNQVSFNTASKEKIVKELVDVPYVDSNLLNFVLVKLPELPGIPLSYDDVSGKWVWGQYRLINLVSTSSFFQTIYNTTRGR